MKNKKPTRGLIGEHEIPLRKCPVCGQEPVLGYACGEYFVYGKDDSCIGCGNRYTEMHTDPAAMIEAWKVRCHTLRSLTADGCYT